MRSSILKFLACVAILTLFGAACGSSDDETAEVAGEVTEPSDSGDSDSSDSDSGAADESTGGDCPETRGVTDDKILFGSSMPLTGNLAALGADATFAIDLTAERINAGGGVNGRMIEVITQDDEYNAELTTANSQYFIDREGVFAIWGSIGSAPLVSAIPLHDESDTPTLFPWAQDLSLYDVNAHPLFFSVNPSAYAQTRAFSNYVATEFPGEDIKVGLLTINSVDGEQTVNGFKDGDGGGLLASEQTWEPDATTVLPQVIALNDAGVTDIYIGTGDALFAQFLQEADQIGLEARFWGSTGTVTSNTIELAGDLAEGAYGVTVNASANATELPGIALYRDEMLAAGAEEAQLGTASLLAYTGGLVLEEALHRAGDCLTVESFVDAMHSIEDFDTGGIMPPLTFTPDNHLGNNGIVIVQVQDGEYVGVGN